MQEKLLVLRRRNKLSQREMAEMLGIATQSYSLKELGKREFTANEMFIISNYFGLKMDDIFLPTIVQNGVNDGNINNWNNKKNIRTKIQCRNRGGKKWKYLESNGNWYLQ